ncbi:MAG: amidohydrolase family protein, partial [Bradymonadaceae bacterium]
TAFSFRPDPEIFDELGFDFDTFSTRMRELAFLNKGLEITDNEALRWITANAAWTLGIQDVTGTIEEGKRADLALWSAHPFSVYAKAEKVWVEGVREYDRSQNPRPWSDFEVGQQPESKEITP